MNTFLIIYMLKIALIITVFFAFYRLIFKDFQFFQANRFYLLYTTLIAFIIPLIHVSWTISPSDPIAPIINTLEPINRAFIPIPDNTVSEISATPIEHNSGIVWSWALIILIIYILGVAIKLFLFLKKLSRLFSLIGSSQKEIYLNQVLLQHQSISTSSFFRYIFWQAPQEEKYREWIIKHEQVHVHQWHSLDNLLLELVCVVQWFNPVVFLIGKELKLLHEYIADARLAQKIDTREYGQLLIDQQAMPPAPLGSTFQSFISQRLGMLARTKTVRWKISFYLFTIPILALTAFLFSSWIFDDSSGLENALNQTITTTNPDLKPLESLKFRWGKIRRDLPQIEGTRKEIYGNSTPFLYYSLHEKISKPSVLESFDKEFKVYGQGNLSIDLAKIELHINNGGLPDRLLSKQIGDGQILDQEIKNVIETNHHLILLLSGFVDETPIHISFELLDFKNKPMYLRWGDMQFDIQRAGLNPIQVVDWKTMASVVAKSHELIKEGQFFGGRAGSLAIKNGTSTVISSPTLAEKIKKDREIKDPIVLQVTGNDGLAYVAVFDDEPNPTLNFETWDELCYELLVIDGVKVKVNEPDWQFDWGPLQTKRPPTTYKQMRVGFWYYPHETSFTGSNGDQNQASVKTLRKMLLAKPRLKPAGGKWFSNIEIQLKHIRPQGIPEDYHLTYRGGMVSDPELLNKLVSNLKEGDFLDIQDIRPVGGEKSISIYLKSHQ